MAFDIYVGPASRYQSGDWKNIGQQIAEEQGLKYVKAGPSKGLLGKLFKPKPEQVYARWREQIRSAITSAGFNAPEWDDSPQQDYVTDRPGWEGHVAFVAQFSYALNPELIPPSKSLTMPELAEDPAFEAELEKEGSPAVAIMSTQFFLPGTFAYAFNVTNFDGHPAGVASLDLLDRAVATICEHCGFDREQIARTPIDQVGEDATFAQASLYGTSIYARLVNEALRRNLPLILDF